MFKRVLQSLSKSLGGGKPAPATPLPPVETPAASKAALPSQPAKPQPVKQSTATPVTPAKEMQTPEELCGITPAMTKAEISAQLKLLYRRYNRGASSLNAKVRSDADSMLDAIVAVREKHFGEI
jgi:hypothetical protein